MSTQISVNSQRVASILRQVCGVAILVMGILTSALSSIHLPVAVSSIMATAGAALLAIEHYVSDPSTGSSPPASPTPPA